MLSHSLQPMHAQTIRGESGICEHNRPRSTCKQSSGLGICEHRRIMSCKDCRQKSDYSLSADKIAQVDICHALQIVAFSGALERIYLDIQTLWNSIIKLNVTHNVTNDNGTACVVMERRGTMFVGKDMIENRRWHLR